MMKRLVIGLMVIWPLAGCMTTAVDMLERAPEIRVPAQASEDELRDCVFRWADNPGLRLQYHPDGVWARDPFGAAVFLVTHSESQVTLYLHWNAFVQRDHYSYMVTKCNSDPMSLPPSRFFGKSVPS